MSIEMFPPIKLFEWIENHREYLKPPVCNKLVFEEGEFIVMIVGGPNSRLDFHIEEGPEFFFQIEGEMILRVRERDGPRNIKISAGEIFLLPPLVPHSPQRFEGGVGLVIERKRRTHEKDGLQWYCAKCDVLLHEEFFNLVDIEKDLPPVFGRFWDHRARRTCRACGHVTEKGELKLVSEN